ncbi:MAG: hypothetical protein EAX86_02355 [Candidatus Heimdallarchaeota archaeon]|nr:hypothetical protein [Candidatus Heimdallarchaeota archaeon]
MIEMLKISCLSTGSTTSQTPVMATVMYEIIKKYLKDKEVSPDFPLACIFDFSSMYSTIQFFATDKILMRMGELTSLVEQMKSSQVLDWSKCSFPSKFVHKESNEPLFFTIPILSRGVSDTLTRSEALELAKHIWQITLILEKAGSQYIFFDLAPIEHHRHNFIELAGLMNSNLIIAIIDMNKNNVDEVIKEIKTIEASLAQYDLLAQPGFSLNGLIFNNITEKCLSQKWIEKTMENFAYPIIGMIKDDPELSKVFRQYEIPTIDSLFHKMKSAKSFQASAEMLIQISTDASALRPVNEAQYKFFEEKMYNI